MIFAEEDFCPISIGDDLGDPNISVTKSETNNSQGVGEVTLETKRIKVTKKTKFINELLPQIKEVKSEFGDGSIESLIPNSLVLVQGALEGDWGNSTNAKKHKNHFGLMGKSGKYMRFPSTKEGIKCYLMTLASHPAYKKLRALLGKKGSLELVGYLGRYSEDTLYANKLRRIIRENDLTRLDG